MVQLVLGWAIYFFIHSFLASLAVKRVAQKMMGSYYKYYRIVYVLIATVGLLIMLFFNASIPSENLMNEKGLARYISLVFAAFGVILLKISFRSYRFSSFVGLTPENDQSLTTTGILGSIRHPIYSATILILIGFWMYSPNIPTLISVICVLIYLPIGIMLEEKKLIKSYGESYRKYKEKVPALFPRLW